MRVDRSLLALLAFVAVGCAPGEPEPAAPAAAPTPVIKVEAIDPPSYDEQASLALMAGDKRIVLGELASNALAVFPRPPGAFEFAELPPGFAEGYAARGWEDLQGGFGLLTRDGRVVLAVRTWNNISDEMIADTKDEYAREIGRRIKPIDFGTAKSGYRFWRDSLTQLMICWSPDVRGRSALTVALGDARIMAPLRMDPRNAAQDLARADSLLAQLSPNGETNSQKR